MNYIRLLKAVTHQADVKLVVTKADCVVTSRQLCLGQKKKKKKKKLCLGQKLQLNTPQRLQVTIPF